jgi:hypothetical protein
MFGVPLWQRVRKSTGSICGGMFLWRLLRIAVIRFLSLILILLFRKRGCFMPWDLPVCLLRNRVLGAYCWCLANRFGLTCRLLLGIFVRWFLFCGNIVKYGRGLNFLWRLIFFIGRPLAGYGFLCFLRRLRLTGIYGSTGWDLSFCGI